MCIYGYYSLIMKKLFRTVAEVIFTLIHPIFKPESIQLFLRKFIALPYSMAKFLDYQGVVPFTVNGKELFMRSYNTPIEVTVFWRGIFNGREGMELSVWSDLSKSASLAIDIGANNGIYALVSSAYPNVKIHAFEPVPNVFDMLLENRFLNPTSHIVPHQMVVSNQNGTQTLYVPKQGWVDVASLDQEFASRYTQGRELVEIQSKAITLDTFLTQEAITTTERVICKIDVEGAEPLILAGAKEAIETYNMTFLIEALDTPAFDAIKKFFPSEYEVYGVDSKHKKLFKTTVSSDRANNYLFTKRLPTELVGQVEG
jgi:FkbM family methyltransferase